MIRLLILVINVIWEYMELMQVLNKPQFSHIIYLASSDMNPYKLAHVWLYYVSHMWNIIPMELFISHIVARHTCAS